MNGRQHAARYRCRSSAAGQPESKATKAPGGRSLVNAHSTESKKGRTTILSCRGVKRALLGPLCARAEARITRVFSLQGRQLRRSVTSRATLYETTVLESMPEVFEWDTHVFHFSPIAFRE